MIVHRIKKLQSSQFLGGRESEMELQETFFLGCRWPLLFCAFFVHEEGEEDRFSAYEDSDLTLMTSLNLGTSIWYWETGVHFLLFIK